MGRQQVAVESRADATEFRHELLGRLGLGTNASDTDIETTNNALVEFLELAPKEVRSWAAAQTTDVDEAFALLTGPDEALKSAAPAFSNAPGGMEETLRARATAVAPVALEAPASGRLRPAQLVWVLVPLLLVAVVVGVYFLGKKDTVPGISGPPTNSQATPTAGAPAAVPVDQAKVAALTKKVTANPKDIASLQGLGDAYFAASDYKNASVWEQKVLAVDPKNQVALLAAGAAKYNVGDLEGARKPWLVAAGLYPKNAEVHYDLGWAYTRQKPPDMAKAKAEWSKVVAIDPKSVMAKEISPFLKPGTAPPGTPSGHPATK